MNDKLKFEIKRKFIHIFALFYIAIYYVFFKLYNHSIGLLALAILLTIFLIVEFLRLKLKIKIPLFHIFWREKERDKLGGHIYFIIGAIISFAFFDFNIAITVLLMTIFGDMAAALFGIRYGKHWIKNIPDTAWEGVIAEFLVDFFIAFFILNNLLISLTMALAATFVETVLSKINDNLSIPIFSGIVGQIVKSLLIR